jgi:glutathione peroxidase-family protein
MRAAQPIALPGTEALREGAVRWNYEKFIINRDGHVVKRFKSAFDPEGFEGDVRLLLVRGRQAVLPAST